MSSNEEAAKSGSTWAGNKRKARPPAEKSKIFSNMNLKTSRADAIESVFEWSQGISQKNTAQYQYVQKKTDDDKPKKISGGKALMIACAIAVHGSVLLHGYKELCGFNCKFTANTQGQWRLDRSFKDEQLWHDMFCSSSTVICNTKDVLRAAKRAKLCKDGGIEKLKIDGLMQACREGGAQISSSVETSKRGSVPKTLYRALDKIEGSFALKREREGFGALESLFEEFIELNEGSIGSVGWIELEGKKHFKRSFMMNAVLARAHQNSKIRMCTIDAGHVDHKLYEGVVMVLEITLADGKCYPMAVALVPKEDMENYNYFLGSICKFPVMQELINRQSNIYHNVRSG